MSKFADLDNEALDAAFTEKKTAFDNLVALESPSVAQVEEASALADEIDAIVAEQSARETAAAEAQTRFAELKNRKFGAEAVEEAAAGDPEDDEDDEAEPVADESEGSAEPAETVEAAEETEVEAAAEETEDAAGETPEAPTTEQASARRVSASQIASRVKRPSVPKDSSMANSSLSITAAANVPDHNAGASLEGIADLAKAVVARSRGFTPPSGDGTRTDLQKFGVATMRLPFEDDLVIDRGGDDMEVLSRAARESRLEGESLTAAGGWCSPSEVLYDLAADESLEGILSLPEVQVNRGGIRYTSGPQFEDFYANAGFIQTEAQAIAGTEKTCVEVDCPDFEEVRLDAVGLCIKVPILTNAAYPELVQRFTSGTIVAHQHMVNANVIGRLVTAAGAARVITGLGSTVTDTLEGLELLADQRRQAYRLPLNRSLEVVVPFWVKGAIRSDLQRRTGQQEPVTDAQIAAHFSARNLAVQYVYDWQGLPTEDEVGPPEVDAEAYPGTFDALMYPAGTFVKGVSDVINLSAVYDAASLATNVYTGLFMEQGLLVAKMQYDADLITLPVCNAGRSGAANLTCA